MLLLYSALLRVQKLVGSAPLPMYALLTRVRIKHNSQTTFGPSAASYCEEVFLRFCNVVNCHDIRTIRQASFLFPHVKHQKVCLDLMNFFTVPYDHQGRIYFKSIFKAQCIALHQIPLIA